MPRTPDRRAGPDTDKPFTKITLDVNGDVQLITEYTDSGMTIKLREFEILTRTGSGDVDTTQERWYDGSVSNVEITEWRVDTAFGRVSGDVDNVTET